MYVAIMSDGYGDIGGVKLNTRCEYLDQMLRSLFYNHKTLSLFNMADSYVSNHLWMMDKQELTDQMYLSEFRFDEDKEWKQFKKEMKSFIEKYIVE